MKNLIFFLMVLCFIYSCRQEVQQLSNTEPIEWKNISVIDAKKDQHSIFMDVRTPEEVADGMIEGAIHIDVKNSNFKSEVDKLDKSRPYIVYCRSGNRSKTASEIMIELGFTDVTNMEGGYRAWKDEN